MLLSCFWVNLCNFKPNLRNFLKTKDFKYAVVPESKKLIIDDMQIFAFPTHLLISPDGKIVKVVNRIEELIPFLNKEKLLADKIAFNSR